MRFLQNIGSKLGDAVAIALTVILLIVCLPIIILAIVGFGALELYTKLWQRLLYDPRLSLDVRDLYYTDSLSNNNYQSLVSAFEKVAATMARLAQAEQSDKKYEGLDIFDNPPQEDGWSPVDLEMTLKTQHATVQLSFSFGAVVQEGQIVYVGLEDDDDCATDLLPIRVKVLAPNLHIKRRFTLYSAYDFWAVVSLLRGQVKFTLSDGQLWAYVPEHTIWLAQYKPNGSEYGLRTKFCNARARKYWYDDKSIDVQHG